MKVKSKLFKDRKVVESKREQAEALGLRKFIFTWGFTQRHEGELMDGKYCEVWAKDWVEARGKMKYNFGDNWAFQYNSEEEAGVGDFGLKFFGLIV